MDEESKEREYQFCLRRVRQLEEDFLKLRESLGTEQQMLLDDYISACEALSEVESGRGDRLGTQVGGGEVFFHGHQQQSGES